MYVVCMYIYMYDECDEYVIMIELKAKTLPKNRRKNEFFNCFNNNGWTTTSGICLQYSKL
jgi:hypothetical protein